MPVSVEVFIKELSIGDKFTIAGVKMVGPGMFISNCKPGQETLLEVTSLGESSVFKITK